MARPIILLIVLTSVVGGCVADTDVDTQSSCDQAAAHLASCVGSEMPTPAPTLAVCEPGDAAAILSRSCDELTAGVLDDKSDFFDFGLARIGCRLGLYYLCERPICDPRSDEPVHELTSEAPQGASTCLEDALAFEGCGACDYYLCRDAAADCGDDGYLIDFAYRYCNQYRLVSEPEASPAGQAWLRRVRRCLITSLDAATPHNDCDAIERAGIDSHSECYAETGFCDLPIADWLLVINTVAPGDIPVREVLTTAHSCISGWL